MWCLTCSVWGHSHKMNFENSSFGTGFSNNVLHLSHQRVKSKSNSEGTSSPAVPVLIGGAIFLATTLFVALFLPSRVRVASYPNLHESLLHNVTSKPFFVGISREK